jgi:tRNA pseudouridine55 synthase
MHGVLLVDKQPGCTSHDVVAQVRRILNTRSVGHAGTLDPLASGLLVVLVGEATKLSDYLLTGDKGYTVTVKLGLETDTDDVDGKVLCTHTEFSMPSTVSLDSVLEEMTGDLELAPPLFSAVKVDGKKMYEEGRKQRQTGEYDLSKLEPRLMSFYNLNLEKIDSINNELTVSMDCSKGSYIRAWAREVGKKLKTGACVKELRRTWSEPFDIEQAVTIDQITPNALIPLTDVLSHWDPVSVLDADEKSIRNGQISKFTFSDLLRKYPVYEDAPNGVRIISQTTGKLVSVLTKEPGQGFRIKRVFNY